MDATTDESFEALLGYLRDSGGFDFTGYQRTSLMRRVRHRMDQAPDPPRSGNTRRLGLHQYRGHSAVAG